MIRNDFIDKFTIPDLKQIVYPPYMSQETNLFHGQRNHLDDKFIWKLIE